MVWIGSPNGWCCKWSRASCSGFLRVWPLPNRVWGFGVGLLLGKVLHRVIIEAVAPAFVRFNPQVGLDVYIWPFIFIVLILAVLGILVNHMLKKVDMLEALKSVD